MLKFYLLIVEGDIEPRMEGPFHTETARDAAARAHRDQDQDKADGLFPLDLNTTDDAAEIDVDAYAGGFFDCPIKTLDDFIRSDFFQAWDEDNRSAGGCGIILADQDRFDRIMAAAENGAEGSTHDEILDDWRHALYAARFELPDDIRDAIREEIDACEKFHNENGTLYQEVG
jgi:hypothetical protein